MPFCRGNDSELVAPIKLAWMMKIQVMAPMLIGNDGRIVISFSGFGWRRKEGFGRQLQLKSCR